MTMLESKQPSNRATTEHHRIPYVAMAAAMAGLAYEGYKRLESTTTEEKARVDDTMQIASHPSDQGNFVFQIDTGLFQDEQLVLDSVKDTFEQYGPIHVLRHGPDVEDNRARVLELMEQDKDRELITISMSKGGLDRIRLNLDPEFRKKQGHVAVMAFESAVFMPEQLTLRGSLMIRSGRAVPKNHISSQLFQKRARNLEKKNKPGFVRDTKDLSFYTAQTAAKTLMTYEYPDESFAEAFSGENVGRIMMIAARKDRLVKTRKAAQWLADESQRDIIYGTDVARPKGHHAGLPAYHDFYAETMAMLLAGEERFEELLDKDDSPYSLLTPIKPVQ